MKFKYNKAIKIQNTKIKGDNCMKLRKMLGIVPVTSMVLGMAVPVVAEQNTIADAFGWTVPEDTLNTVYFWQMIISVTVKKLSRELKNSRRTTGKF